MGSGKVVRELVVVVNERGRAGLETGLCSIWGSAGLRHECMMDVGVWKENRAGRQKHNSAFFQRIQSESAHVRMCKYSVYESV